MGPDARRCLNDVLNATGLLNDFTFGKTLSDYGNDPLVRSATERQFGVIGEAISRLARIDEATAARITEYRRIISFRNVLIHDYDSVDNLIVWNALQYRLPVLILDVEELLEEE